MLFFTFSHGQSIINVIREKQYKLLVSLKYFFQITKVRKIETKGKDKVKKNDRIIRTKSR
jgi:hypothetical protein